MFHFDLSVLKPTASSCPGLYLFGVLMLLLVSPLAAQQNYLEIPVQLEIEDGNMDEVVVKIKKDGKDAFTQSGASRLRFKLDFQRKYTLIFTKPGYVSKTIDVHTKVPAERLTKGFEAYRIGVKLQKQSENNPVAYKQAVAQIKFDSMLDEFNFETDYSKSLLSAMQDPSATPKKEPTDTLTAHTSALLPSTDQSITIAASEQPAKNETAEKPLATNTPATIVELVVAAETSAIPDNTEGKLIVSEEIKAHDAADHGQTTPVAPPMYTEAEKIQREDIVEKNKLITCYTVEKNGITTEYRRVLHQWGGLYYFKNKTTSITENQFVAATGYAGE
jgi:hypothetical protein